MCTQRRLRLGVEPVQTGFQPLGGTVVEERGFPFQGETRISKYHLIPKFSQFCTGNWDIRENYRAGIHNGHTNMYPNMNKMPFPESDTQYHQKAKSAEPNLGNSQSERQGRDQSGDQTQPSMTGHHSRNYCSLSSHGRGSTLLLFLCNSAGLELQCKHQTLTSRTPFSRCRGPGDTRIG